MIEIVDTFSLVEENRNTNSYPMTFTCRTSDGFAAYYVKYIHDPSQYDCLVYEIVCNKLAKYFGIKVPEIAYINVKSNSFDPKLLVRNNIFFKEGVVAFGSREINNNVVLSKLEKVPDKHTFNAYANPLDLIKITLFDLQTGNKDRNEENFNLLVTKHKPSDFYAIDHYFCFGGALNIGNINPKLYINRDATIIRSDFSQEMLRYLNFDEINQTIHDYYYLCNTNNLESLVDNVFVSIPQSWQLSANLSAKIKAFITESNRLKTIREQVSDIIRVLKK